MADEIKNATENPGADISKTFPEMPKRKRTVKKSDDKAAEGANVSTQPEKTEESNIQEKIAPKRKPRKNTDSDEAKADGNTAEAKPRATSKRKPKAEKMQDVEELKDNVTTASDTAEEKQEPMNEPVSDSIADEAAEEIKESEDIITESTESILDDTNSEQENDVLPPLMNIEHFFDYRASSDENENAEEADNNAEAEGFNTDAPNEADEESSYIDSDDDVPVIQEYENYTILDEIEYEAHEKELRERARKSRDNVKYDADKPRAVDKKFDMIELFVFTLVVIMLLTTFVFKHSVVDGPSMMNTLQHGDHLIISDVFYTPKQYDLIVFQDYESGYTEPIVKRVIATEGQHVLVESMDTVYVDGKLVPKDFVFIDGDEIQYREELYPFEWDVPEGEVYVMGDHRNASDDSRYFPCKSIKVESILGKVLFRIYPFDKIGFVKYKPTDE